MNEYKIIDVDTWARKKQYHFFKDYDQPCFNVTVPVDVTQLYHYCKSTNRSFFLTSLHVVLMALNKVEALRTRLIDGDIRLYDFIDGGCTIFNEDLTFTFCYFNYEESLTKFIMEGKENIHKVQNTDHFEARDNDLNLIHCSSLPWISFTSFSHATDSKKNQSIPKLIFGKYQKSGKKTSMAISLEAMHCLADGYHIGLFYEEVNKYIAGL